MNHAGKRDKFEFLFAALTSIQWFTYKAMMQLF